MLTDKYSTYKEIKVVDFGIATGNYNLNIEYTNVGTIRYLAPEVITS